MLPICNISLPQLATVQCPKLQLSLYISAQLATCSFFAIKRGCSTARRSLGHTHLAALLQISTLAHLYQLTCYCSNSSAIAGVIAVGSVRLDFGLTSPHQASSTAAASSYGNLSVFNPRDDRLDAPDHFEPTASQPLASTRFKNRSALCTYTLFCKATGLSALIRPSNLVGCSHANTPAGASLLTSPC